MALTHDDLNAIRNLMVVTIEEVVERKELVTKDMISHLPSKLEFYDQTDKLMGELKAIREEHTLLSARVYENHEPRIKKIEKKVGFQTQ